MKLTIKTEKGIKQIEVGNKNMDAVIEQMNIMNLLNYNIIIYAAYKDLLGYDAEICEGRLYIHRKHMNNKKILFDLLAIFHTVKKGLPLTQCSYEEVLFIMLTIALENRLPTGREIISIHNDIYLYPMNNPMD